MEREIRFEPTENAQNVQPGLPSLVANVRQRVVYRVDGFRRTAPTRLYEARARTALWRQQIESVIRRNPRTAMLSALGLGFVFGLLLRRWRSLSRQEVHRG